MAVLADEVRLVSSRPARGAPVLLLDGQEMFSTVLMMALRVSGVDALRGDLVDIDAVLQQVGRLPVGLVLLDLSLGRNGHRQQVNPADLVSALRARRWLVLVVSDRGGEERIAAAIVAGAAGVCAKSSSLEHLLAVMLAASAGRPVMTEAQRQGWVARERGYRASQRDQTRRFDRLSAQEREVLALLIAGQRATAIAEHFVVSMATVRTQIRAILVKLEVSSQLEAVALATHRQ
jgi:DNA-binding NarL/FixJ family response regulator